MFLFNECVYNACLAYTFSLSVPGCGSWAIRISCTSSQRNWHICVCDCKLLAVFDVILRLITSSLLIAPLATQPKIRPDSHLTLALYSLTSHTCCMRLQIPEEGDHSWQCGDEVSARRVQFTDNVDKARASDASTLKDKDAVAMSLLQPQTTDDGYLTPTTRKSTDDSDVPYLVIVGSPTNATAGFDFTAPSMCVV